MIDNGLKLNSDKSHLIVISNQQAKKKSANQVKIQTDTEDINPTSSQKLLCCWIQDDLKWTENIRDNREGLLKALNIRLNAIKRISGLTDFRTRNMIAKGFFMSKLTT